MPSGKIYDRLLSLPLFQGLSHKDLSSIIETTRFDFRTYAQGHPIISNEMPCTHLLILMSGVVEVTIWSDDRSYSLSERLEAPLLLEAERLFGLSQFHARNFKALEDCRLLAIEKQAVLRLTADYLIFRINLLNAIATLSQRQLRQPWHPAPKTLAGRIVRFVEQHALRPAGQKTMRIKMIQLASELNDSRLDVSRALHDLQSRGLVSIGRGVFTFPALEEALRDW